jgi:hypothetical protein
MVRLNVVSSVGLVVIPALIILGVTACSSGTSSTTQTSMPTSKTSVSIPAPSLLASQLAATSTTMAMSKPKTGFTTTSTVVNSLKTSAASVTITGYITTEDDYAMKLGADTAGMINMKVMAMSGLGITTQKADGSWEFYYFNGTFSSGDSVNGKWAFNGTAAQLDAWNIVLSVAANTPKAPVPVTVTGVLKGDTGTNPGNDADGLYFPVLTVSSIVQK